MSPKSRLIRSAQVEFWLRIIGYSDEETNILIITYRRCEVLGPWTGLCSNRGRAVDDDYVLLGYTGRYLPSKVE